MIKKTLDCKSNLHTVEVARKCIAMPTTDIVQLIVNQRQRNKQEMQQRLCLFVQLTETFSR